jgi:hypothetical protein
MRQRLPSAQWIAGTAHSAARHLVIVAMLGLTIAFTWVVAGLDETTSVIVSARSK